MNLKPAKPGEPCRHCYARIVKFGDLWVDGQSRGGTCDGLRMLHAPIPDLSGVSRDSA